MLEYRNVKTFLQKSMFKIVLQKFFWLKKLKILCHGHMLLVTLTGKKLLKPFLKKQLQKINQKEFRVEKVIEMAINYMSNGKAMMVLLLLIKKM